MSIMETLKNRWVRIGKAEEPPRGAPGGGEGGGEKEQKVIGVQKEMEKFITEKLEEHPEIKDEFEQRLKEKGADLKLDDATIKVVRGEKELYSVDLKFKVLKELLKEKGSPEEIEKAA